MSKCSFCNELVPISATHCPGCGAQLSSTNQTDPATEIRSLLQQGARLEAVKLYRTQSGCSLRDAKKAIEDFEAGQPLKLPELNVDTDLEPELLRLLGQGQKLAAVRLYREKTGTELIDAKRTVEMLAARHGMAAQQNSGCGLLAFIAVAIAAGVWYYFFK